MRFEMIKATQNVQQICDYFNLKVRNVKRTVLMR